MKRWTRRRHLWTGCVGETGSMFDWQLTLSCVQVKAETFVASCRKRVQTALMVASACCWTSSLRYSQKCKSLFYLYCTSAHPTTGTAVACCWSRSVAAPGVVSDDQQPKGQMWVGGSLSDRRGSRQYGVKIQRDHMLLWAHYSLHWALSRRPAAFTSASSASGQTWTCSPADRETWQCCTPLFGSRGRQ